MNKTKIIKSVADAHSEISEQYVLVTEFLKVFNKKGPMPDVDGLIKFFNTSMVRHFLKENVIFDELLKSPGLDEEIARVVADTVKEHDTFIDEFRQLSETAREMEDGQEDLSEDFIKKCQYIIWALSKHAQVEDLVIFPEAAERLNEGSFKMIEAELLKI